MSELELQLYLESVDQASGLLAVEELDDHQIFDELSRAENAVYWHEAYKEPGPADAMARVKQIKKEMTKRGLV